MAECGNMQQGAQAGRTQGEGTEFLSVKEVSVRTGIPVSTLRYYDSVGLTPQVTRNGGGARQYTEEDLCWLELICCLKHSGMSLPDIRRFMCFCLEGEEAAAERKAVLLKQEERLRQQIACLQCSLEMIGYKLAHYREVGVFHFAGRTGQGNVAPVDNREGFHYTGSAKKETAGQRQPRKSKP